MLGYKEKYQKKNSQSKITFALAVSVFSTQTRRCNRVWLLAFGTQYLAFSTSLLVLNF
ncbi:protein of unknown function [Vibrio tapetis subsp. tapetis]|uniref:Uncharacterized protein n=1 Tax=Vibrio tapetis subsp. tapetis TaxID=1671868 RepID=A0A2N8ZB80_9VIBR|nr:protein of unknown function [Vibrio tapetis subsp. tapetis]